MGCCVSGQTDQRAFVNVNGNPVNPHPNNNANTRNAAEVRRRQQASSSQSNQPAS